MSREQSTQELVESIYNISGSGPIETETARNRRLFREMVKGEKEANMLTPRRRRSLVAFARRLKIDKDEARLLIRGVEYECGLDEPPAEEGLSQDVESAIRLVLIMLIVVVVGLVTQWFWSYLF